MASALRLRVGVSAPTRGACHGWRRDQVESDGPILVRPRWDSSPQIWGHVTDGTEMFSIAAAAGWETLTASIDAVNSGLPSFKFASFAATIARWLSSRWRRIRLWDRLILRLSPSSQFKLVRAIAGRLTTSCPERSGPGRENLVTSGQALTVKKRRLQTEGSGRRWRMSKSLPRGRLKAPALVSLRVLNSPATLSNQCGWICFKTSWL